MRSEAPLWESIPNTSVFVLQKQGVSILNGSSRTSDRKWLMTETVFGCVVRLARAFMRSARRGKLMDVIPFSNAVKALKPSAQAREKAMETYKNDRVRWLSSSARSPCRPHLNL